MDLFFYDFEFRLVHVERDYISTDWVIQYNGVGTFEARFPKNSRVIPILMGEKYLVVKQGPYSAIITGKMLDAEFLVFGRTANWILTRRTVPVFPEQKQTAKTLTTWFLSGFPFDANGSTTNMRQSGFYDLFINGTFTIGNGLSNQTLVPFQNSKQESLEKVIATCLERVGAGHEVVFDVQEKKWVFRFLMGTESALLISEANKNASNSKVNEDCLDYYTGGWYEERFVGDDGVEEIVWVSVSKDDAKTGIYKWECVLEDPGAADALSALSKKVRNNKIDMTVHNLELGIDYNLGDIVRVQISKGGYKTTLKKRISGVKLHFDSSGFTQNPELSDVDDVKNTKEGSDGDSL